MAYGLPGTGPTGAQAQPTSYPLAQANNPTQISSHNALSEMKNLGFGNVPDAYKDFNAFKNGSDLYMGKPGSDQFSKWNDNKRDWDTVANNDKINSPLTEANKISKVDINTELKGLKNSKGDKLFNDKDLEGYKDFNAYKSGDKLFINRKGESDFHELNGEKKWDKVTDPDVKANLSAAANPELKTATEKNATEAIKTEEAKAKESSKSDSEQLASLGKSFLSATLGVAGLSSLAPKAETMQKLVEKSVQNAIEEKIWDTLVRGNHEDAMQQARNALDLKESSFPSDVSNRDRKELQEDRLTVEAMAESYNTRLSSTYNTARIELMRDLKEAFPPGRIDQFKEAMTTGVINGRSISATDAQKYYQDSLAYQSLVAGKFNTADGQFSIGALDLANTIHAGGRTNERMRGFGF